MCTKKSQPNIKPVPALQRWIYLIIAYSALAFAGIGVVIPGLPSTEFVLLSAWAASKSSPKLQRWLHTNAVTGKVLYNWHNGKLIARKSKWGISLLMAVSFTFLYLHQPPLWLISLTIIGMLCSLIFIWRRPEPKYPIATQN